MSNMNKDISALFCWTLKFLIKPYLYLNVWYLTVGILLIAHLDNDKALEAWTVMSHALYTGFHLYVLAMIMFGALMCAYWVYGDKIKVKDHK